MADWVKTAENDVEIYTKEVFGGFLKIWADASGKLTSIFQANHPTAIGEANAGHTITSRVSIHDLDPTDIEAAQIATEARLKEALTTNGHTALVEATTSTPIVEMQASAPEAPAAAGAASATGAIAP